jgi:hypothetical protein
MKPKQDNEIKASFDSFRAEIEELCKEIQLLKKENVCLTLVLDHYKELELKAQKTIINLNNQVIELRTPNNITKVKQAFDAEFAR